MSNQVTIGALFHKGTSQVRPPYFNGKYFCHWKVRMKIYAKANDVKVWRVIKKGNYLLPVVAQPPTDLEDIDEYTDEQMVVVQVNTKAKNLLYNAISGEEYEKLSSCDTAKEMWDKLEVTYERTSKVKKNSDKHDELQGDLISFENTHLKKTSQEEKKKTVAFKTTTEGPENDIDDDPEALKEEIAMISRNMNGLMRRYRNTKMERISSRQTRQYNEQDKNERKDILDLTLKESQKMLNELKRLYRENKDLKLKLEICEIERDMLQDEVQELKMQLNGMRKSTSHSSVKSNHVTYKSTGKGRGRTESTNFINLMF
ncbi:uncharacterized protein [Nicotiana tomentosiformis]|uniref:uncharacterized protein n=1 Tax=Nicotiana tomentosiformis TaxID=4098 RepID=UPI00388C96EC